MRSVKKRRIGDWVSFDFFTTHFFFLSSVSSFFLFPTFESERTVLEENKREKRRKRKKERMEKMMTCVELLTGRTFCSSVERD